MLASARHLALEAGAEIVAISGRETLDRPGALLRPVSELTSAKIVSGRSMTCVVPPEIYQAIEQVRRADPSAPSRSLTMLKLIVAGLEQQDPSLPTEPQASGDFQRRYACAVCGQISLNHFPKKGFNGTDQSKRLSGVTTLK